jgi:transcriptional regulator with GAF, ATPase, and Fis domain
MVRETLEKQSLRAEVADLHARLYGSSNPPILGSSRAIRVALDHAASVAELDTTVLLTGETGTGKDLFAQFIHGRSSRRAKPFVAINCAALPEPLLESELFGHERGAFTGAVARKPGKFELASGGTLFLDEVADMSLALQAKLLRALEARQVEPLGATRSVSIDVRVVAATNRDLAAAVRDGAFREDLFYRLQVFPIALPALRDRREDIPVLVVHFLEEFGRAFGKLPLGYEPDVLDALQEYAWPGNVRELRHAIERAVILAKGPVIQLAHLPEAVTPRERRPTAPPPPGSASLAELQREAIMAALDAAGGNQTRAAKALGLTRNQIQYWIRTKFKKP